MSKVGKSIFQLLPNLNGGGAERVAVNLANHWATLGYDSNVVLMQNRGPLSSFLLPTVSVHDLRIPRIRNLAYRLIRFFQVKRPDITLVHMWPITSVAILSWRLAGSPGKLFVCEHVGITHHVKADLALPLCIARSVLRLTHPRASGVIAVSKGAANDLARLADMRESSISVIHNPIAKLPLESRVEINTATKQQLWRGKFSRHLLSVGTLKSQKNPLLLLDAFSRIANAIDAGLVILGDGPERLKLVRRIIELGLCNRVSLWGFNSNPMPWMNAADLFVLSSDFEGFANVLVESLSVGTPVVSTRCPYGPDEIIDHGVHGLLVPTRDSEGLSSAILEALNRHWDPELLQLRAKEFCIAKQADCYLKLFN